MKEIIRPGYIKTKGTTTFIGDDGILRQYANSNGVETLESAIENIAICKQLLDDERDVVLVDISKLDRVDFQARKYYSSEEIRNTFTAVAFLVNSFTSKVIGNFMMGINKMKVPIKLFCSEPEAIDWLNKFR
jgi:hypothetical protein